MENQVQEKTVEAVRYVGIRFKGSYCQCGQKLKILYKALKWNAGGPPFNLYYDEGYREEADIETCVPVKREVELPNLEVRTLPGGRCLSLLHRGPYEDLGTSYAIMEAYAKERGLEIKPPCRELYIKGPGMFFKGNPKKYITEIQFML